MKKWEDVFNKENDGWFDYKDFYDLAASNYSDSLMVEIGVWCGKSISYLMLKSGVQVFGVDTFQGDPNNPNEQRIIKENNLNLLDTAINNLKALGLEPNFIVTDSVTASKDFEDSSCSFVFIDGGHLYEQVCKDIKAWKPKVKNRGLISGHDYDAPGVKRAVEENFKNYNIMGNCWYAEIK